MERTIYKIDFPNNLKVARRKTSGEAISKELQKDIYEIEQLSNNQNTVLDELIKTSIPIGIEK